MYHTHQAPQTSDGWITDVDSGANGCLAIKIRFPIDEEQLFGAECVAEQAQFACRSRIARLGIDIRATSELEIGADFAELEASVRAVVPHYNVAQHLNEVFLPGLRVGRLVFCQPNRRLDSETLYDEYSNNAFKLPAAFSIDASDRVVIQPHRLVYDLDRPPSVEDLIAILTRPDGRSLLNRIQIPRTVDNILLRPGEGVITSCTMFLHRHFMVLESGPTELGRHMQAVALDPITTRGPRVFLEFFNDSDSTILNPTATGIVYLAEQVRSHVHVWDSAIDGFHHIDTGTARDAYEHLAGLFPHSPMRGDRSSYFDRPIAIVEQDLKDVTAKSLRDRWKRPVVDTTSELQNRVAQMRLVNDSSAVKHFGTHALKDLDDNAASTVLMQHFPNLTEHLDVVAAAARGSVRRLIFQKASFEHGPFLSSRDQARLADLADLEVEVLWCNEIREHIAVHIFRGYRGFFCELDLVDGFRNALVVAVYGSSRPFPEDERQKLQQLITALHEFFGNDLAIITGGGPGAMYEASRAAKDRGLTVGANYLEIEDQQTNLLADFYQVFQENCRHSRQRWFEISSFHVFCIGGVGTLEEVGVTLTDIKLGIAEGTPLVFFGQSKEGPYWKPLEEQLHLMADEERGPDWLRSNVLITDDPGEVVTFYKSRLSLG